MLTPAPPPALIAIASELAGTTVSLSCEKDSGFSNDNEAYTLGTQNDDGSVVMDPVIHLARSTCNELSRLVIRDGRHKRVVRAQQFVTNGGEIIDMAAGGAIHLLEHEALHIREQSIDEARVECDSQLNRWTAIRSFKFPAWRVPQIMRGFTLAHRSSPDSYLGDC